MKPYFSKGMLRSPYKERESGTEMEIIVSSKQGAATSHFQSVGDRKDRRQIEERG